MKYCLDIESIDEVLYNLNSIKQVLEDEWSPSGHGDLLPEILTLNDIIKQLSKEK